MNETQFDFSEGHVATLFNEMADEYDELEDEWYPHIFQQIEDVITGHFRDGKGLKALDVGCGTGWQTYLLQKLEYKVTGLDIAIDLIKRAKDKLIRNDFSPHFVLASALNIPFPNQTFDLINCCGSTLSLIPQYDLAVKEMSRVVKTGGFLVIETEQKWNPDILWALIDGLIGGRLGYEQELSESWRNLTRPVQEGILVDYPFVRLNGEIDYLPIRCFSVQELTRSFSSAGLEVIKFYGVHSVSNLLPSTLVGDPNLNPLLRKIARALIRIDARVKGLPPFNRLGCSIIFVLRKL